MDNINERGNGGATAQLDVGPTPDPTMSRGEGSLRGNDGDSLDGSVFNINSMVNNHSSLPFDSRDDDSGTSEVDDFTEPSSQFNPAAADFTYTGNLNGLGDHYVNRKSPQMVYGGNGAERQFLSRNDAFSPHTNAGLAYNTNTPHSDHHREHQQHQHQPQHRGIYRDAPPRMDSKPASLFQGQMAGSNQIENFETHSAALESIRNRANMHLQKASADDNGYTQQQNIVGLIYQVHFKRSSKYYMLHPAVAQLPVERGNYVKVEADRGEDLGVVGDIIPADRFWAVKYASSISKMALPPKSVLKNILRLAYPKEVKELMVKTTDENTVTQICREILITTHPLPINIVDSEYQFDRKKLIIYHDSKQRVDFREFVKDLYGVFKTRIWMQQYDLSNSRRYPSGVNPGNGRMPTPRNSGAEAPQNDYNHPGGPRLDMHSNSMGERNYGVAGNAPMRAMNPSSRGYPRYPYPRDSPVSSEYSPSTSSHGADDQGYLTGPTNTLPPSVPVHHQQWSPHPFSSPQPATDGSAPPDFAQLRDTAPDRPVRDHGDPLSNNAYGPRGLKMDRYAPNAYQSHVAPGLLDLTDTFEGVNGSSASIGRVSRGSSDSAPIMTHGVGVGEQYINHLDYSNGFH